MAEWNHRVDEAENRLYIELGGHFTAEEAERSTAEVKEKVERLDPGFEVITDLEDFIPGDQDAMKYVEEGKRVVREHGAEAAVRVMGEGSTTGQMQFERLGEDEEEYAVAVADTVEQAEKLLDKRREQESQ
ncbi:MAG: hypothetical protein ABEJ94_05630 [Halorientalis sp.]